MALKKTKTIKNRLIYVYLPSKELVTKWKNLAKEGNTSLSKFVIEHVENEINKEEDDDFVTRLDLLKKVKQLEEENEKFRKENKQLNIVVDKLQEDLQIYRLQPFVSSQFEGIRKYEQTIIDVLKRKGFVKTDNLLHETGINPRDSDAIKAVSRQMDNLEQYGLIKKTREGWRWIP